MKGCSIPITVTHGWDQPSFLLRGWKEKACYPYVIFIPLKILVGWSWFSGFQIIYGAGVAWKGIGSSIILLIYLFANLDPQKLLLMFKNRWFKLIMMLTRCNVNELFHFITSVPKSILVIRMTIKHSGHETFIIDSVNSPTSVWREKDQFTPLKN